MRKKSGRSSRRGWKRKDIKIIFSTIHIICHVIDNVMKSVKVIELVFSYETETEVEVEMMMMKAWR